MQSIMPMALFALAACQPANIESAPAAAQPTMTAQSATPALVVTTCSSCHAIRVNQLSPLVRAPSFVDIANMHGLSHDTLVAYLNDAHNYPDVMDVELDPEEVEAIATYMLTLRSEDYRRTPS